MHIPHSRLSEEGLYLAIAQELKKDLPAVRAIENLTTLKRDLQVFDKEGVIRYIETRLVKAGYQQDSHYSPDASLLIAKISKGVPRVINLLAQKALINTFNAKLDQVQAHQVRLAAATIDYAMLDELDSKPSWFKRLRNRKV